MPGFTGHSSVLLTPVQSVDRGFLGSLSCVAAKLGLASLADSFYLCSAVIFKRCPGSFQASENEGFFAKCRVDVKLYMQPQTPCFTSLSTEAKETCTVRVKAPKSG